MRLRPGAVPPAGAAVAVHCCHCTSCQRETGSAFALNGLVETEHLILIEGVVEMIDTPSESGKGQIVARCRNCRVALWSHYGGMGTDGAFVRIGTLDTPAAFPPDVQIFARSRQPWHAINARAPAYDVFYSRHDFDSLFGEQSAARYRMLRGL